MDEDDYLDELTPEMDVFSVGYIYIRFKSNLQCVIFKLFILAVLLQNSFWRALLCLLYLNYSNTKVENTILP